MLAYKVDAKPIDWSEKVFIQPKLDGVRCIIQLNDKGEFMLTLAPVNRGLTLSTF